MEKPSDPEKIGRYQIIRRIATGGMGEIFLGRDPQCRRHIALKRIRADMKEHAIVRKRFLREAFLTSQLAHPGVIPIYEIGEEGGVPYYTMPFIEGRTLKALLKEAAREAHQPAIPPNPDYSIPSLARVFIGLCHVVAYAHHRGILHRDLKPTNVMLGAYGEVFLVDWGLAKQLGDAELPLPEGDEVSAEVTRPGKTFGTLAYLAPERALGEPASPLSDIYALGVILYEILTLHLPFRRKDLAHFRATYASEELLDPAKLAPYRNVPRMLARIVERALQLHKNLRYPSIDALIADFQTYLEGRSEWFEIATLKPKVKEDWEFQEHLYFADHLALAASPEEAGWVSMMVSRSSFPGNVKLLLRVCLEESAEGIGILVSVPEMRGRAHPHSGYCLWVGSDRSPGCRLLRAGLQLIDQPNLSLPSGQWVELRLEKVDNTLRFYLNDQLKFTHVSYLPLEGSQVGLLYRDLDFRSDGLKVYVGNTSIQVNCLAIPDAFLAAGDRERARMEYERIARSFPERDEGREALFRVGITALEQAKEENQKEGYDHASDAFSLLHSTSGAPLEYLGKSLVYQALGETEEEAKCFDLAFRRYHNHPLLYRLQEQVIYRTHELSRHDRRATYRFALLLAQHLPAAWEDRESRRLFSNLQRHWEPLPFCLPLSRSEAHPTCRRLDLALRLAFWLARPHSLLELIEKCQETSCQTSQLNGSYALLEMVHPLHLSEKSRRALIAWGGEEFALLLEAHETNGHNLAQQIAHYKNPLRPQSYYHLMEIALDQNQPEEVKLIYEQIPPSIKQRKEWNDRFTHFNIWAALLLDQPQEAQEGFGHYPLEELNQENSPLYFLYGCYLALSEGNELAMIHLSGVLDFPYPRTHALLGHYLTGNLSQALPWEEQAFLYEKRELYRQLSLYYHVIGEPRQASHFRGLAARQVPSL